MGAEPPLRPAPHPREAERLRALAGYAILDTPRETAFDDLAVLASEICDAPIAVVNLVAEARQWFKAEVGLGVRETPLESSFCAHAILQQDYLEVPDATQDPRFDCNPLVTGPPGLRFYAGALLRTGTGLPIGTLCVLDTRPRRLSDRQAGALRRLAGQAMSQLELRLALIARTRSEERLRFLDRLAGATQGLTRPGEVMAVTARLLGEHLGVAVCAYADMEPDQDGFTIRGDWTAPGAASIVGRYSLAGFGEVAVRELRAGRPLVTRDTLAELGPEQASLFLKLGLRSTVCMPLVRDGRLTALMAVHGAAPRDWSEEDLSLIADTTARSWAHIERTRSEAALRESEARLKAVFDAVPVGIVLAEAPSGRITGGNAQAERIFGHPVLPSADVGGYRDWTSRHADGRVVAPEEYPLTRAIRGQAERPELEVLYQRGDGREAWVRLIAAPIRDGGGTITGGVVAALDIDRGKRADAALRRLNETLEARVAAAIAERDRAWNNARDLLVVVGTDGVFRAVNPAWEAILGWRAEEIVGRSHLDLIHPEDHTSSRGALATASRAALPTYENRLRHKDGGWRWISWVAAPEGDLIYASGRDVTAEKERQAELEEARDALRQAQKMETVGQLTGGVAHDFNNLLQIITGNLEILNRNLPADAPRLKRAAENAQTGARRAATLTQRLLAFSRRQPLAPKPIDVNRLVAGMSELLRRTLGETIELETPLAGELWRVEADPNQLENAILNLAVNARDAMADGGRLTIETANLHLDRSGAAQHPEAQPGQYVAVRISDTGTGMDRATLARVFEPFFTTKEVGKGTGLGLSMVYGFVKQSGGHVAIRSESGRGTAVTIHLPRLLGQAEEESEAPEVAAPEGAREETILVCEDDDDVRAYSVEALRELGYRVLEAHDGPSALRLLERQEGRVDLLFSDVVLPGGMTGADVAAAARGLRPGLRVLFTTGYARDAIVHDGRLDAGVELITKPFGFADLAARVREVLDAKGA